MACVYDCGMDFSSTEDSTVFTVVEFIGGRSDGSENEYISYEISRKEYFIQLIKEQPFFT